jgi:malate permease and related proteins
MIETLINAYTPLLIWTGLGLLLSRFVPDICPKIIGQMLYWVGVPLQLYVLARQTQSNDGGLIALIAVGVLILGFILALLTWNLYIISNKRFNVLNSIAINEVLATDEFDTKILTKNDDKATLGSFILAVMLGNTGFIGLPLAEILTHSLHSDWAILFSVTSNVVGTYGIAVIIASYFGQTDDNNNWLIQLRDVITVPSLWAFFIGWNTRQWQFPSQVELILDQAVWVVVAFALVLVGLRLGKIKQWSSLQLASISTFLKVFLVPIIVGLSGTFFGLDGDERLVLVLMSGTPTGLAVLILAEVYNLDKDLLASTVALTFVGLLLVLPLWVTWFG